MKKIVVTLCMLMLAFTAVAQVGKDRDDVVPPPDVQEVKEPDAPLMFAEQQPEFPGGQDSMMAYIKRNVVYPVLAKEEGVQGRVIVSFVVMEDGSINDIKVLKSPHQLLNKPAIDVIKGMPKWKPGKQNGKAVKVRFNLPISFKLE